MLCKMEFYKFSYWTWKLNLNSVKQQLRQHWVSSKTLSSIYTIQPVVKPVVKPVSQPVEQTVAVRSTGCQPPVQPVVKPVVRPVWQPVWQPAVSCKGGIMGPVYAIYATCGFLTGRASRKQPDRFAPVFSFWIETIWVKSCFKQTAMYMLHDSN